MTRNGKIIAGAAVILTLGSAAAVAHRHGGWHHRGHHGWGGPQGMMGPVGRLCRGNPAEKADLMLVRLEYKVNPTDAQKPALEELKTAVRSAAQKIAAACPRTEPSSAENDAEPGRSAPKEITARLADAEAQLTAVLEGLKVVRPAAEKLYATLDEAQKKAVSEMGRGKHGRWGRMHGHWDRRDGERGPPESRGGPGGGPERGGPPDDGTPEREGDL